ncbi:DUF6455 family protein [Allorhizobium sp. BGMRC 0089]|uniref:DUF6455 family protein n=1 Tax=Allorhizobium sonneratiae TaxID=2934936 RepID=UPI0020336CF1|nr:DUF6455 family protein [Allorhizobium sonneratiae]MCM2292154.1 DUF6455 family protein [Allorhizobium sonneratiae]
MTLTVDHTLRSVFHNLITWASTGWERAAETEALANMDDQTLMKLAADCGITPDQLYDLAKAGPHAADEMPKMLRALNIDPVEVASRCHITFRDMQIACSCCPDKATCRKHLAEHTVHGHFLEFCPNAAQIIELKAHPDMQLD